jgi:cell division protein FtsA
MSDVDILAKNAMVSSERTVSETPQEEVVDEKPKFKRAQATVKHPEPTQERSKPVERNSSPKATSNRFDGIKKWFSDFFD